MFTMNPALVTTIENNNTIIDNANIKNCALQSNWSSTVPLQDENCKFKESLTYF